MIVSVSVSYNCQTGNNKKLKHVYERGKMEYEIVTQKIVLSIEIIPQNAMQLPHLRLSWHGRFPSFAQIPSKFLPELAV